MTVGGYIPDELIEEIRVRSDIVEVISDRVLLKKSGANYKGLCPFHSEKTPSFIVSPAKQIFHCFGCNEGGNVYQFVMKIENISFPDSVLLLARKYGINITDQKIKGVNSSQKNTLYDVNAMAAEFFQRQLSDLPQGKTAREYLRKRGITDNIIESFKIGYASTSWDGVHQFLKKKGISTDIQNSAGLIKERENGGGYVDRFRERIIFTISDSEGRVVGFGGRVLNDTDSRPKYLNSPETLIYKKGNILYGLNITKDSIRKSKEAFLVEGYFDLITVYQHGIKNIIATSGTALTEDHARILRRYTDTVTLVFDGDEAGRNASDRGGIVLLNGGVKVKVISLPHGNDPDNFIREKSGEGFLNIARESKTFMEYIINKAIAESDLKSLDEKIRCINSVIPFLSIINNSVERSIYLSLLAEKTGVSEKAIMDEMSKKEYRMQNTEYVTKKSSTPHSALRTPHSSFRIPTSEFRVRMKTVKKLPLRSDVALADTWDLSSLFPNDEAWESAFAEFEKRIPRYARFRGKLGESAKTMAACLRFDLELDRLGDRLGTYAFLRASEIIRYQKTEYRRQKTETPHSALRTLITRLKEYLFS